MSLFPFIQPEITIKVEPLPMAREIAWDFERDLPILKNGEPVFCEGAEAVAVWAWNALHTVRYRMKYLPGITAVNWNPSSDSRTAPPPKKQKRFAMCGKH